MIIASQPIVSWLLCTHVADENARRAIDSCLDQTFRDFELVIVANGERHDEVATTIARWYGENPIVRVLSTQIRHLTFSLNFGLHSARAQLVARMDADDIAYRDRLAQQVDFMSRHPEIAVLGSAYDLLDDQRAPFRRVEMPKADAQIRRALVRGYAICHPSVMFRRQVVISAGGYLGGTRAQDYELWCRLALEPSIRFANLPSPTIGYRATSLSHTRQSRAAYATVAAAQWRNFAAGAGISWAFAALHTTAKAFLPGISSARSGLK